MGKFKELKAQCSSGDRWLCTLVFIIGTSIISYLCSWPHLDPDLTPQHRMDMNLLEKVQSIPMKMISKLEPSYKDRVGEMDLFSLEKIRLWGSLITIFQHMKWKGERVSLLRIVVLGQVSLPGSQIISAFLSKTNHSMIKWFYGFLFILFLECQKSSSPPPCQVLHDSHVSPSSFLNEKHSLIQTL